MGKRIFNLETKKYIGQKVQVAGWVERRRDHGKIIFIDLRDRSGILQVVFSQKSPGKLYQLAQELKPEWVISLEGLVKTRPKEMINPEIETGEIEISPQNLEILNKSKRPPFPIDDQKEKINEAGMVLGNNPL